MMLAYETDASVDGANWIDLLVSVGRGICSGVRNHIIIERVATGLLPLNKGL